LRATQNSMASLMSQAGRVLEVSGLVLHILRVDELKSTKALQCDSNVVIGLILSYQQQKC
jgi:hypothetical protein